MRNQTAIRLVFEQKAVSAPTPALAEFRIQHQCEISQGPYTISAEKRRQQEMACSFD